MPITDILRILRDRQADLAQSGVIHAAIFGSAARSDHSPKSDVDILIDIAPSRGNNVFDPGK